MIRPQFILAGVAIAALAGAGGYVLGTHGLPGYFVARTLPCRP